MRSGTKALGWDSYARYAEIEEFIKSTPSLNKIAEVEEIGKSYENKALYAVKISSGPGNKKAIFVDASEFLSNLVNNNNVSINHNYGHTHTKQDNSLCTLYFLFFLNRHSRS